MSLPESEDEFQDPDEPSPADIRLAAMNLLARREHTCRELQTKLVRRFNDTNAVAREIERLGEENLQSDTRFAQSYLRVRADAGFGQLRIRQEMRERGLAESEIQDAFTSEALDWTAIAEQAYVKKYGEPQVRVPLELKEQARRARFMQYRGFNQDQYEHLIERK